MVALTRKIRSMRFANQSNKPVTIPDKKLIQKFFRIEWNRVIGRIAQVIGILVGLASISLDGSDWFDIFTLITISFLLIGVGSYLRFGAMKRAKLNAHLSLNGISIEGTVTSINKSLSQFRGQATSEDQQQFRIGVEFLDREGNSVKLESAPIARVHFMDLSIGDKIVLKVDPDDSTKFMSAFWIDIAEKMD